PVTCMATDAHGNSAMATFTVTVQDTTPPVITVPDPIVAEATGPDGAKVTFSVGALDKVDGAVTVTCTPASGSTFPLGTTTVTCTTHDKAGNSATATFTVTVVDTTPPVITAPDPIVAEAIGPDGAPVSFTASAIDTVDGPLAVNYDHPSGSTFPLGT